MVYGFLLKFSASVGRKKNKNKKEQNFFLGAEILNMNSGGSAPKKKLKKAKLSYFLGKNKLVGGAVVKKKLSRIPSQGKLQGGEPDMRVYMAKYCMTTQIRLSFQGSAGKKTLT